MRKSILLIMLSGLCLSSWAQSDTSLTNFRKLFRKRIHLPYLVAYTDKEFVMDSIRNTTEYDVYIKYRSQIAPKPVSQLLAPYLVKRFIRLDTLLIRKEGDTCHAQFYALGVVGHKKDLYCFVVERQFISSSFRSSEKFLCTFDKKYKQLDSLCLASEVPGKHGLRDGEEEYEEEIEDRFKLPWFQETLGVIYKDMSILIEDEIGKSKKYKVNTDGKISKKQIIPLSE